MAESQLFDLDFRPLLPYTGGAIGNILSGYLQVGRQVRAYSAAVVAGRVRCPLR
jgi:hypothetical protein